jgi:hypothetical protein
MEKLGFWCRLGVIMTALRDRFSTLTVGSALATVAFSSGFISYTHIAALTLAAHGNWKTAHLMPLCVDGQIVIGSAYFMDGKNRWQRAAGLLFGVLPGIGESLYANWESGIVNGTHAAVWATVPAQAFACSAFLFERWLRARKEARRTERTAQELLAAALADADGLRESLAAASALAEASVIRAEAVAATVLRAAPGAQASPAAPQAPAWPLAGKAVGPLQPLRKPRARPRPTLVPQPEGATAELPADERELRELVNTVGRNDLVRRYGITSHRANQLRAQYLSPRGGEQVA